MDNIDKAVGETKVEKKLLLPCGCAIEDRGQAWLACERQASCRNAADAEAEDDERETWERAMLFGQEKVEAGERQEGFHTPCCGEPTDEIGFKERKICPFCGAA